MALHPLHGGLFGVDDVVRLAPGTGLPVRCTVVPLPDGDVLLHSPVRLDDATAAAIDALGPVRALLAPNLLHHLFLADATARWPDAAVWAPPGLATKRPDLRIDHRWGDDPPPWSDSLAPVPLHGASKAEETVFVHRPSGTLLVADLLFHVRPPAPAPLTPWLLRLTGTWDRLACSRVWGSLVDDRAAFAASLRAMLDARWDALVPCHGQPIPVGAHAAVSRALARWT